MDPKEKKVKEEELNVEETQNGADEQPQNEQAEEAAPLTHEEELEKELEKAQETHAGSYSVTGSQEMMSWGMIMFHVVIVSLLSNIGKLCPMFFYRDRKLSERLALSIGMFTRGEVGAGIIFIALGYNLGGPALVISVLTLVLNLILTGIFVLWVKNLALRSYAD